MTNGFDNRGDGINVKRGSAEAGDKMRGKRDQHSKRRMARRAWDWRGPPLTLTTSKICFAQVRGPWQMRLLRRRGHWLGPYT